MNIVLWIFQGLLAIVFLMAGGMKLTQTKETIYEKGMAYVEDLSPQIIKGIGLLEILGALGIILPGLTGILSWLTPLAAAGLAITMIGAGLTHFRRGEYASIGLNVFLFTLAAFVAYGRFVLAPL